MEQQSSTPSDSLNASQVTLPSPTSSSIFLPQEPLRQTRRGYKFGDITRSLIGNRVNKLTGKDQTGEAYEFGDLSRWIDACVKDRVNQMTGKADSDEDYEFGDLTQWALQQVGNVTRSYTGKEEYQVGDLSKEVLRRVTTGEYDLQDVWLALRVLLSVGFTAFSPLASVLPIRLLLDLVNMGLTSEVSGRLLEALAGVLDRRVKQALTGNADYQLGDITKNKLQAAIGGFTGKASYEVGDITRQIHKLASQQNKQQRSQKALQISLPEQSLKDLEDWDAKFLQAAKQSASM